MSRAARQSINFSRFPSWSRCFALAVLLPMIAVAQENANSDKQAEAMQRQELNEGYSLLYASLATLKTTDEWLYAKVENDRVDQTVTDIAEYAAKLYDDLSRLADAYPAIQLDLKPLPEMEQRKRDLQNSDYLKSVAPVVGESGPVFERTLLLTLSGALNHLRYQAQVIAEAEPVSALKEILKKTEQRFADLYEDVVIELNEHYFKHNTYKRSE